MTEKLKNDELNKVSGGTSKDITISNGDQGGGGEVHEIKCKCSKCNKPFTIQSNEPMVCPYCGSVIVFVETEALRF